jgi:predicted HTH transcriptional regulator
MKQGIAHDELVAALEAGTQESKLVGVEFKREWQQHHGRDISAIANSLSSGWVVVGVSDQGQLCGHNLAWLKKTEESVSNQIRSCLNPSWVAVTIVGHRIKDSECLFIEVRNQGEVVKWSDIAYKLVGTTSTEMKPHEIMELSLKLPGADYSKAPYEGNTDPSLVTSFAQKVVEATADDFQIDVSATAPNDILRKLNIFQTNAAGILFGNFKFRIAHFDENGDILDQQDKTGLFNILSDSFIEEIQSWTRRQGTAIRGNSIAAPEESPYPQRALREILANAVAHALYQKDKGNIVVELHPNRITVRNNCHLEAKAFVNKWFSRINKVINKHLMNVLRAPRITDEQGSGKIRIFRYMLEAGKREPIIEFNDMGDFGRWSISLYNDESNLLLKKLFDRIGDHFTNPDEQKLAMALVLWRKKLWSEIETFLDENYKYTAHQILEADGSPIVLFDDTLYTRRWARVALEEGQVTKQFSEAEKASMRNFLQSISFSSGSEGFITAETARNLLGLSNSKPEMTQLSRLFLEWKQKGHVKPVKKGQWQFLERPQSKTKI